MDIPTSYDWLFPKVPFSRQAKILETQLLYSQSLTEKSSDEILQGSLSSKSLASPSEISDFFSQSRSSVTGLKQKLSQLTSREALASEKLFLIPEDRLLVGKRQHELLKRKEKDAFEASKSLQRETLEMARLRNENRELGQQLERTVSHIGSLQAQLGLKEMNLASKKKAIAQLNQFLQDTAVKQTKARDSLKVHMEHLLERAETAETETDTLRSSLQSVGQTSNLLLRPGDSLGTVRSSENDRLPWSRKSHPGRDYRDGRMHALSTGINSRTSVPDHNRQTSRLGHLSTNQSLLSQGSDREALSPDFGLSPTISQIGSGGYTPDGVLAASLGTGSVFNRNHLTADGSRTPLSARSRPFSLEEDKPYYNSSVERRSYTSTPQFTTNPEKVTESRQIPQVESTIMPSTDSSLLQSYPNQRNGSLNQTPTFSDRASALNFLKDVAEDVLKKREMENQPALQNASSHPMSSSYLSPHEVHVNGSTLPLQKQNKVQGLKEDFSSSSSDFGDETDEQTESDEEQATGFRHPAQPAPSVHHHYLRAAWLSVFTHLNTETLLICAQVCRAWRVISKHPSLWRTVRLSNRRISSKFLQTISVWCQEMEHLSLEHLRPRCRARGESKEKYAKTTRGSLESGLEYMLSTAGDGLLTLKIEDCSNILTERSLFLVSCYCRNLYSLTYVSQTDPIGHEVIWALGAGCRNIASLKVPPRQPCQQRHRLSNRCLQMIGRCWPLLLALSVGGPSIDVHGLVSIAHNCPRLQVLEMDHMQEITETVAKAMCRAGLRGLHTLILRNTLISPAAVMQFNGACCQLKSLTIHLTPSVCGGNNKDFHNIVSRLRALTKRCVLSEVLQVHAKFN